MQRSVDAGQRSKTFSSANFTTKKPTKPGLTDLDFNDLAPDNNKARNEGTPEFLDQLHCSRATQTVGKVPKVYLTQGETESLHFFIIIERFFLPSENI